MDTNRTPKLALRPLDSLFSDAWKLYKERWSVLVEIALLPTLIVVLGTVLISLGLGWISRALGALILVAGWITLVYTVLPIIYSIHNTTGVDASYKATIGWFWSYVWVAILAILAVLGSFVMLIIPGIWLATALSFTAYVFVTEKRRGVDALRQSKDYIKGYWWAVLGRALLLSLIYIVAIVIVQIPAVILGGRILSGIVSAVMELFFIPFSAIYSYMIFSDLRERKPELAGIETKEGTGFIKASAIVGIIAPILFVILAIVLAGMGAMYMMRHPNVRYVPPSGYPTQVVPLQPPPQ